MKFNLAKTKRQIPLIVLLCIFALLGIIYYFIYIPGNERRLDEEHFQWLQNVDENIRTKINGVDSMLKGYMKMYQCSSEKQENKKWKMSTESGLVIGMSIRKKLNRKDSAATASRFLVDTLFENDEYSIEADSSINRISILLRQDSSYVAIQFDFPGFVKPLLPSSIFDHYVIFCDGNYIYEDFHSGLSYKKEDSLLTDSKSKTIAGSTIIQQKVGGVEYRMFLQPIIFGNKKLIIAGLHSSSRFDSEKRAIPEGLVGGTVIIAFALFLLIPWLRILFMGKYDRLQLKNIFWVSIVTKLLTAILFLYFFGSQTSVTEKTVNESVEFIDSTIGSNFNAEVIRAGQAFKRLIRMKSDSAYVRYIHIINLRKQPLYGFPKSNCSYVLPDTAVSDAAKRTIDSALDIAAVREMNWLSDDGAVLSNWTFRPSNDIQQNYKDRRYFTDAQQGNNLISLGDSTSFALDQIVSRTNGDFCSILAQGTGHGGVAAMAFDLTCMNNMVLPVGYSAMIIDNSGQVRYHSKAEKNLMENIFAELSKVSDDGLKSSIKGRFRFHCTATYFEKSHDVWLTPLKNYPLFIVVMRSRNYINSRDVQTFTFSMSMIFLFLIVAVFDLSVMIFASSRRSPFKKQFFVTSWLWPRRSSEPEYIHATFYHLIVFAALLCIYVFDAVSFIDFFFMLILTLPALTLYLNILFLEKYRKQWTHYVKFKIRSTIALVILIVLYFITAINILKCDIWHILVYFLFLVIVYIIQRVVRKAVDERKYMDNTSIDKYRSDRYIVWYTSMLFTRMIVTCGLPAVFFYTNSFNYEQNLMARFKQLSMFQQLEQHRLSPRLLDTASNVYKDNAEIAHVDRLVSDPAVEPLTNADLAAARIFNAFGRLFGNITFDNDDYYKTASDDSSLRYNNIFRKGTASTTILPVRATRGGYWIISADPKKILYQLPDSTGRGIFWISFFITLGLFFFALLFIIKKVFAKDVLYLGFVDRVDKALEVKNRAEVRMIVVAVADEYQKYLCERPKDGQSAKIDPYYFDFKSLCRSDKEADFYKELKDKEWDLNHKELNKTLCVLNFEEDFSDLSLLKKKVSFLEKILDLKREVIIITSKHPIIIASEIHSMIDSKDIPTKDVLKIRMEFLLGRFTTIIHPLERRKNNVHFKRNLEYWKVLQNQIAEETKYTFFLEELRKSIQITDDIKGRHLSDAFTLKIQAIAHNFYKEIWNALTENEKFVLYDLAEDGLVNTTNMFSLNLLISRGIVILEDGGLHIFNRSFRNFIVTAIGKEEMEKLNHKYELNARWGNLNRLLIFSGITVLIFLGVTQNLAYTKAIGALTGLGSAVLAVINILNSVGAKSANTKNDVKS